jgi:antitoxin HicB
VSYSYTVVLRREPEGSYTVTVPALPGCLTSGENVADAIAMARDVIPLFMGALRDQGLPVPADRPRVSLSMRGTSEVLAYKLSFADDQDDAGAGERQGVAAVA